VSQVLFWWFLMLSVNLARMQETWISAETPLWTLKR
jgi:hypothetical protein